MKFSYKFSNLLGTVYRKGNLYFTPDGNSVISPVGNRLTIFDLKNNKSRTLSLQSKFNYTAIGLSPNGNLLLAVNEEGEAHLISLVSCTVIHRHKFQKAVQCVQFSPDGKFFAVAKDNLVLIFRTPGEITGEYNPFVLERFFYGAYDDITWLDWSTDSRFLAVGSRDNSTRICAVRYLNNFRTYILGGHTDAIVGCFFEDGNLHLNTISRNGQLCIWECSLEFSDITDPKSQKENEKEEPSSPKKLKKTRRNSESETESGSSSESEDNIEDRENEIKTEDDPTMDMTNETEIQKTEHPFSYKKLCRHYLGNEAKKENSKAYVTAVAYHKKMKILVIAFSVGSFFLYELPEANMIHSLSISDYAISTACFNSTGDWIALAASGVGQLLVWEWQSEQYIMKQQGHSSEMSCITYSPDGQYIASGGEDSKIKLWNVNNGFCFVTFHEHKSSVTGIKFSNNKKFIVSSSLDGTVRAFDIIRYRNFRTFTSPRPIQFSCVAIDSSDELVVAGGQDIFEIYLWSMKVGKLLEIFSGHEGPVSSVEFSPVPMSSTLISGSWDKTVRIWNCIESSSDHETIDVLSDVTCVAFKPNGEEFAVTTLNGNISFFNVKTAQQIGSIEGRNDLGSGVSDADLITAKKNLEGKSFTSIVYTADGENLLAAGKSPNVCIYNIREGILLKKFEITQNHSLDGIDEFINRRKITEFGNLALIEEREKLEGGNVAVRLPGVLKGDMATRNFKPEIKVFNVRFSPTGQSWSAATTEGLMIYSLDKGVVFDPFNLSLEITPKATRECLKNKEYSNALLMALKINEIELVQLVFEQIPSQEVELVVSSLPNEYVKIALQYVTKFLQSTQHIEFYLKWSTCILTQHGMKDNVFEHQTLLGLHESLSRQYESLKKICNFNKFTLKVLSHLPRPRTINDDNDDVDVSGGDVGNMDLDENDMILIKSSSNQDHNMEEDSDFNESNSSQEEKDEHDD